MWVSFRQTPGCTFALGSRILAYLVVRRKETKFLLFLGLGSTVVAFLCVWFSLFVKRLGRIAV